MVKSVEKSIKKIYNDTIIATRLKGGVIINIGIIKRKAEREKTLIFYFEYGSYFGGACEFLIIDQGDGVCHIYAVGYNGYDLYWDFKVPICRLKALQASVRPARKWLENYEVGNEIDDGYGWKLVYIGQGYDIKTGGYMANPSNYFMVGKRILKQLKKIRESTGVKKCEPLLPINGYGNATFFVDKRKNREMRE